MLTQVAVLARRTGFWRGVLGFALTAVLGFAAANVSDWLSFRFALQVADRVRADEWAAMFAKARELAQGKLLRLKGGELPAEFARLGVSEAYFFRTTRCCGCTRVGSLRCPCISISIPSGKE